MILVVDRKLLSKGAGIFCREIRLLWEEYCDVREEKGGKEQNLYLSKQHPCPKNISKISRTAPL
jgi:hypothetical protein